MTATPPLLEATDLRREADDGTVLLGGISLTVDAGSSTALLGPPGSGKTLLLRALALLDPIQGGEVRYRGRPVDDQDVPGVRRQLMLLQQRPTLIEGTVRDNLQLPFQFRSKSASAYDEAWVLHRLAALTLDPSFLNRKSDDLSGGESQLVALLRALQLDPSVLLLDEPTSSLDAKTTDAVEQLVQAWRETDPERAFLVVTHAPEQAARLAAQTVTIRDGVLSKQGDGNA